MPAMRHRQALVQQSLICAFFFALGIFYSNYGRSRTNTDANFLDPDHYSRQELRDVGLDSPLKAHKTFLLIAVISAAKNAERRKAIRETWLNLERHLRSEVIHFFVVGKKGLSGQLLEDLEAEGRANKDLLLLPDVEDTFDTLTQKVLATFVLFDRGVDFKYLMKADDDTFVVVDRLYDELQHSNYPHSLYWGYFDGRAPVFRGEKERYRETEYVLCDRYIPYALGGGYVLSSDLVGFIASNSERLRGYRAEDASLGTWLAPLKVHRVHDTRFDTEWRSRGCLNTDLVSHKQSVEEMRSKQYSLVSGGALCERETIKRKSYEYNWTLPPSKCCPREK